MTTDAATTDTPTIDPQDISKGTRLRIKGMPEGTVYVVDSVQRPKGRFYAVSENRTSGHWFDFDEIAEVLT
jgi:hypothetical protein